MAEDQKHDRDRDLLELLADYPVPNPDPGFFDRALVRAIHAGERQRRNRRLAGFGSLAVAAAAAWIAVGLFAGDPQLPAPGAAIPGVTIALEEPHTVNLVFASATKLDSATLTVTLPAGIELDGFPGQREITWETSLDAGRNHLPLTLVALSPAGGELQARLEHDGRQRTFRLLVGVNQQKPDGTIG
jgi:hypothetical protein